jgi:hypothetical protein
MGLFEFVCANEHVGDVTHPGYHVKPGRSADQIAVFTSIKLFAYMLQ